MRQIGLALIIFGGSHFYDPPRAAADAKPFVWAGLGPKSVTVGQPVTLTVDVYVPTWFTTAPRFPQIDVKDAVVIFLEEGGENLSQVVGEQSYAGQRRQYLIYPQRAGDHFVPPFEVQVRYAIDAQPSPRTAVSSPGGRFSATIPDAAAGLDYFVATPSFHLTAATDRPLERLKVGDSFTRTITMTATQAFAMMLPPLHFPPGDGLAVYPAPPSVSDSGGERDEVRVGRRVESATYVLQREGSFRLPPIEIAWWDTGARALRRAQLAALDFTVAPNPNLKPEIPLPPDPTEPPATPPPFDWRLFLRTYGPPALGLLLVLGLFYRLLQDRIRSVHAHFVTRRRRREESEAACLKRLEEAARSGTPAEILAATYRWLDRRGHREPAARLDLFAQESGDPDLPRLAEALVDSALGVAPETPESPARCAEGLGRAARRHPGRSTPPGALGPLNPGRQPERFTR